MPRRPPRCGTTSGYRAHYERDEKPCESCRAAWAHYRNKPYRPARFCACGRRIKSAHDACWRCRDNRKHIVDLKTAPAEIEWIRGKHGLFVAASVREPSEFSTWQPRVPPKRQPQWEQVGA